MESKTIWSRLVELQVFDRRRKSGFIDKVPEEIILISREGHRAKLYQMLGSRLEKNSGTIIPIFKRISSVSLCIWCTVE